MVRTKETKSVSKVTRKWTKRVTKGKERQASVQKIHKRGKQRKKKQFKDRGKEGEPFISLSHDSLLFLCISFPLFLWFPVRFPPQPKIFLKQQLYRLNVLPILAKEGITHRLTLLFVGWPASQLPHSSNRPFFDLFSSVLVLILVSNFTNSSFNLLVMQLINYLVY